ncbi:MAG: gamma-glutamyl-gamma-aminobutyrate hydrolase family protein [Candidatus Pacearchaeota archaeon]
MTILLLNICKEKLHYFEFVKPIERILKEKEIDFYTKHYSKFTDKDLKADKIIICGTSLKDNDYLKNPNLFKWVGFYKKPILGICAGAQILCKHFKGNLIEKNEIGLNNVEFKKEFLGATSGSEEVYSLHNLSLDVDDSEFDSIAFSNNSKTIQAIKHKEKPIYGVLFHPEVRNEEIILEFSSLD